MRSAWLSSTFLRVLKFLQIKDGGRNCKGEPILEKVWIIWSPLLYFNFKSFMDPTFLSFIRFHCILYDWVVLFSESWYFYKLKRGDLISGGKVIFQKVWIIWSPLSYFNFESFMNPNFSSFIRSQCILHESGILFSNSWNFYKLKRRNLVSEGNQFCRKSELFVPVLCISILKIF